MARTLVELRADAELSPYLGQEECLVPYRGAGEIALVILGQDPTVRSRSTRRRLTTVLDLDRDGGNLHRFVGRLAGALGTSMENVYATNLVKSFSVEPLAEYDDPELLRAFAGRWMGLLLRELAEFPAAPVVTLGQPILAVLAKDGAPRRVKHFWSREPRALAPHENVLGRWIYPFPHQPSIAGEFYGGNLDRYAAFVRAHASRARP
ncbi:MAG TPA: hypothetical protein VFQ39_11480 [Longimicrobium sp.]|nr:hypothetical protein [Longimicrobium sp.]